VLWVSVAGAQAPAPSDATDGIEGMLTRKHEWESTTKKASNRFLTIYLNQQADRKVLQN